MVRNYITKLAMLCLLLSSLWSMAQIKKQRKADHNFDTYAYVDAIKIYQDMIDKGQVSASILSNLADAYYFNGKYQQAFKWYDELFEGSYQDKNVMLLDKEYYFRYAQSLKAMNYLTKADQILQEFAQEKSSDSRGKFFITYPKLVEQTTGASRFTLSNLSFNSELGDYGATLLGDRLIFTSSRDNKQMKNKIHSWTNQYFTKLYATNILQDGSFSEPELFAKELSSKQLNIGSAIFTKDGNTMYFNSNNGSTTGSKRAQYNQDESSLLKIYKSQKQPDGSWGTAQELPFNLPGYNTAHPALTPDEKWLYFSSDRQGTLGQSDLFRVAIYETGRFGQVEHLSDKINTEGRESFAFISSDNFLYFSSDGHPGFGGLDLFKSFISSDNQLGEPVNLGPDINSAFDDFAIYIDPVANKGFVSSNKPGAKGTDDIYLFIEQTCYQTLEGMVIDVDSNEGISQVELAIYDKKNKLVENVFTDQQGLYKAQKLLCGQHYTVKVNKQKYFSKEFVVDVNRDISQRVDVQMELIQKGDDLFKKLKLDPIHFDFDSDKIRSDAQVELQKVVDLMLQHPSMKVDVRSHTDSQGEDAYNMKLSERRAKSTIQWMISKGVNPGRLTGRGYGETQLVNSCENNVDCSDQQHQENRRSEFIIIQLE
ncbi:OmpA family protein [Myroides sp. LJL119]